jgi:hypothetical protein
MGTHIRTNCILQTDHPPSLQSAQDYFAQCESGSAKESIYEVISMTMRGPADRHTHYVACIIGPGEQCSLLLRPTATNADMQIILITI